jgi:hypothetical protein
MRDEVYRAKGGRYCDLKNSWGEHDEIRETFVSGLIVRTKCPEQLTRRNVRGITMTRPNLPFSVFLIVPADVANLVLEGAPP